MQEDPSDDDSIAEGDFSILMVYSADGWDTIDRMDTGLGLDTGSQEGSHTGPRSVNETPVFASGTIMGIDKARVHRGRSGVKRSRNEDEDDDETEPEEEEARPLVKRNGSVRKSSQIYDPSPFDPDGGGGDGEVDSKVYCTCRQVSYGEMIGCDDDDCDIEWVRLCTIRKRKTRC